MRYALIDGFRGFFLFTMMVVHLNYGIKAVLPTINHHRLGWVEDAQGFVFVSGLVIGMVYGRMLLRSNLATVTRATLHRIGVIFRHHLFLAVVITLLAVFFAARVPEIYHRFGDLPVVYGGLTLLLLAGPEFVDILPMYVVFMALTPLALSACQRGHHLGVMAVSVAVWLVAQTGMVAPALHILSRATGLADQGIWIGLFFNRLAWQILYFAGLVAGMAFVQGKLRPSAFAAPVWKPVFLTALAVTLGFVVLAGLRHVAPDKLPQAFQVQVSRPNLGLLRVANFASDVIVVVWLLTAGMTAGAGWRRAGGILHAIFTWRPLVFLGQHSLHVYTYHVLLVYLFLTFVDFREMAPLTKEIVPFLAALSLFLPAAAHAAMVRRVARPARPPARSPAPSRESPATDLSDPHASARA